MMAATETVYPILGQPQSGTSWRKNRDNFYSGQEVPSGSINFALAWFEQAHDVSSSACKVLLPFGSSSQLRRP
jgi:hypothetical protein